MSGWPSGLRRCVQVAVYICRRGFESHFWHTFSCFRLNGGDCYGSSQRFVLISLIQYWITWHFISWTANLEHYSPYFVLLNVFKVINIIGISKNYAAPNKGLEPLTLRLKVWCSTDWANRALDTKWRRCASDQETNGAKYENGAASRIRTCEGNSHWISSPTP